MHEIDTRVYMRNNLKEIINNIKNDDEFIEYANDKLVKKILDDIGQANFTIELEPIGEISVVIAIDKLANSNFATSVIVRYFSENNINKHDLYAALQNNFQVINRIQTMISKYIDRANEESLKEYHIPVNKPMVFEREMFYTELDPFYPTRSINYMNIKIDPATNGSELYVNLE